MPRTAVALAAAALLSAGCAHPPGSFRLIEAARTPVLVPPGVKDASVARASLPLPAHPAKRSCPPSPSGLRIERNKLIVTRDALSHATAEELHLWTASLETAGCIPAGESFRLNAAVIDALPLEIARRRALAGAVLGINLTSANSLRVVSPVFRPGTSPGAAAIAAEPPAISPGASPNALNVELRPNPDLTGYEIAWYDILDRPDGPGFRIVPRSAEVHIAGQVEKKPGPGVNRFDLAPHARWFRYFLMTRSSTDHNDYNIVLLSAPTAAELEARTAAFRKSAADYLHAAEPRDYAAMTREFGVNPYIRVKVKGSPVDLEIGATVRQAIEQETGRGTAERALPGLRVLKPYKGKLVPVVWSASTRNILDVSLEGGEEMTW